MHTEAKPLKPGPMAPPKVVKRSSAGSSAAESDIAIQRPVPKLQNGKGMIPPPPTKTEVTISATAPTLSVTQEQLATSSPSALKETPVDKSTQNTEPDSSTSSTLATSGPQSTSTSSSVNYKSSGKTGNESLETDQKSSTTSIIPVSMSLSLGNVSSGSSEKLVANESPNPAVSPKCLRPQRKIEDVTTVKRQPKTGWL